jgi:hypothetical protein
MVQVADARQEELNRTWLVCCASAIKIVDLSDGGGGTDATINCR